MFMSPDREALSPGQSTVADDRVRTARLAAHAAVVLGGAHAAVTVSWAMGSTVGLDLLGGTLAARVRDAGPSDTVFLWVTAVLKLAAATPGIVLLTGPRLLRRPATVAAYAIGGLLALYGGTLIVGQALVVGGAIEVADDADRTAILGHLLLWDPWFFLWGCALLLAARLRPRSFDSVQPR